MFLEDFVRAGMADDVRAKNEWVLKGLDLLDVAAVNASHRDLPYLSLVNTTADRAARLKQFPVLDRFVSANVTPVDKTMAPFKPYIVREVKGARLGSKPVRVGFLGLTEDRPARAVAAARATAGYAISDPVEAAKKYVPELRKKCDVLIVLAYMPQETAKRVGVVAPGIDAIVDARGFGVQGSVDEAGDAIVAYANNQTKYLGELRLYHDQKTKQLVNYIHRDVPLDEKMPDDPFALKLTYDARAAILATQRKLEGGAAAP